MTSFNLLSLLLILGILCLTRQSLSECEDNDQIECSNGLQCIYLWYVCDGEADCWDSSDEIDCRTEPFVDRFVIVADMRRMNLFQIGVDGGGMVPLLPTSTNGPVAVAFDELANEVYWTDVMDKTINSYSLNTRATRWRTVYRDTSGTNAVLDGLALDPVSQMLFYCDAGDIGKVGSMSTKGLHHRVLIKEFGMKPRSIVVDAAERLLYWTDWGTDPAINRARMDTKGQYESLIDDDIAWPNALTIDFSDKTIYWADAKLGTIETAQIDGTRRRVLFSEEGSHYFNMHLTPKVIYFTDWTKRSVQTLDRETHAVSELEPGVFGKLSGLFYCCQNDSSSAAETGKQTGSTYKRDRYSSGSRTPTTQTQSQVKWRTVADEDDSDYANTETYVKPYNDTGAYLRLTIRRNREL